MTDSFEENNSVPQEYDSKLQEDSLESNKDRLASQEGMIKFHEEVQEALREKADQLGVSVGDLMNDLGVGEYSSAIGGESDVAKNNDEDGDDKRILDWKSLGNIGIPGDGEGDYTVRELQQIKSDVLETIDKYPNLDSVSAVTEFVAKHKNKINVALAVIYLSSFGTPLLHAFMDHDIKIETKDGDINAKDLLENPDVNKTSIPENILQELSVHPLTNDEGLFLKFAITDNHGEKYIKVNAGGTYHPSAGDSGAEKDQDQFNNVRGVLEDFFERDKSYSGTILIFEINSKDFQNNKKEIVSALALAMNISQGEVSEHFDSLINFDNQHASGTEVSLENLKIEKSLDSKGEATRFYESIVKKYDMNNPDEKQKAIEECNSHAKEKGYDDFWHASDKEKIENPSAVFESHEGKGLIYSHVLMEIISENIRNHYDVNELKKDSKQAYEAVLNAFAEEENIHSEDGRYFLNEELKLGIGQDKDFVNKILDGNRTFIPTSIEVGHDVRSNGQTEGWVLKNFDINKIEESKDTPEKTIKNISDFVMSNFSEEKGFSADDRCGIFMGIKCILAEKGLKDFDKFGVVLAQNKEGQPVDEIITVGENGKVIYSVIDFSSLKNTEGKSDSGESHKGDKEKIVSLGDIEDLRRALTTYNNDAELDLSRRELIRGAREKISKSDNKV